MLASRADALRSRREREALASAIYRLLSDARRAHAAPSVRAPISREAIEQNRHELLEIAAVLRQGASVSERGVATIRLLVTDGSGSPLYHRAAPAALRATLSYALHWL
jgi:hypothetical protein